MILLAKTPAATKVRVSALMLADDNINAMLH
jgi:hypothetical protein